MSEPDPYDHRPRHDESTICTATKAAFRVGWRYDASGAERRPPGWIEHELAPEGKVWTLSSEGQVESLALSDHLRWIATQLERRRDELRELRDEGWWMDIFCMWISRIGHGGPTLPSDLLERLGALGVDVGLDFYSAMPHED